MNFLLLLTLWFYGAALTFVIATARRTPMEQLLPEFVRRRERFTFLIASCIWPYLLWCIFFGKPSR